MEVRSLHFSAQFDGDISKLQDYNKEMDNTKTKAESITKTLDKTGKNLSKLGGSLMKKVTLPLAGIGTASIKTVADFDDGMSKVKALTGATGDEFNTLREQAKKLGSETAFSAKQASEGMQILASSGKDVNEIGEMIPQVLSMASAGTMELDESAGVITQTMAQFGMTIEDTQRITDVYAKSASEADTNISELAHGISIAGGNAKNMNMDLEQTNAMFALFADAGLKGSRAGTAFNSMYRDISSSAENGKIKIGESAIAVYEANGEMKDMASIMTDVEKATASMTDEQRASALAMVFSDNAMQGVNRFLGQGSEKYRELEASIRDSKGASEEMAEVMEDNLAGAFRGLQSAGEGFLIEVGDVLKDDVRVIADGIASLTRRFGELDEGTQRAIVKAGAIAMVIPPIIWGVGKLTSGISKIPSIISGIGSAIGFLTSPMGLVTIGIAGIVAGGVLLYKNWDTIKAKATEVWGSITDTVDKAVGSIKEKWEGLKNFLKNPIKGTVSLIQKGWNKITGKDGEVDGSHYSGLSKVPFDGYIAELHENEEVLTADDPRNINNPDGYLKAPETYETVNNIANKEAYETVNIIENHSLERASVEPIASNYKSMGNITITQPIDIIIQGDVSKENLDDLTIKIKQATREELERIIKELKIQFGILGGEPV